MARPDPRTLWLVGPIALALAPQIFYLPVWASVAVVLALLWRLAPFWRKEAAGQRTLRLLLVLAGLVAVYLEHRTLFGPQGGVSLLVLMAALKLLEAEGRRDHGVMVLIGYFLLMTNFINDQSLSTAAWLLGAAVTLTASLVVAQSTQVPAWATGLKLGGLIALQAIPLAILLFVLFPRLPSPVGGLLHAHQARTGLSDSMSPGSVSQLIQSDAIAFRVEFASADVDGRRIYWRGPVLWDYDGLTWRRQNVPGETAGARGVGTRVEYHVTLEPHEQTWLPVYGLALLPPSAGFVVGLRNSADMEWQTARPIRERLRYTVRAWPEFRLEEELTPARRARALRLPDGFNPRSVALGRQWAAEGDAAESLVRRALAMFRRDEFFYTLQPPLLGEHAVDDFLFATRRGFCEHYAGAFVTLMRAAGVPARVVTGYQGGELNPVGDYWIVRQRDAHAWTEVWLDGQGWVKVDPTAAVAPQRIEQGIGAALPLGERPLLDLGADWLMPARQAWDFLNNGWNQWVLGYDFQRQRRFLASLHPSLGQLRGMLWALLGGAGILLALLVALTLRPARQAAADAPARLYARFRARLARIGLPGGKAEGPGDFARRAARARPDLADEIGAITGLYVHLRYGGADPGLLATLRRRIRAFRPRRG